VCGSSLPSASILCVKVSIHLFGWCTSCCNETVHAYPDAAASYSIKALNSQLCGGSAEKTYSSSLKRVVPRGLTRLQNSGQPAPVAAPWQPLGLINLGTPETISFGISLGNRSCRSVCRESAQPP
jgi:hypothetical protein